MQYEWKEIGKFSLASGTRIDSPWRVAIESFDDAQYLKIKASVEWSIDGSVLPDFDGDGLPELMSSADRLVLKECRFGALLGKIGGSSADQHVPETAGDEVKVGEPFAIGHYCIVKLPDGAAGPLFIGINSRFVKVEVQKLELEIFGARTTD